MQRLTQFDVSRQFLTPRSKTAAQIVFGLVCAGAMIGLRAIFDLWAPSSGPFALIYPTVLLATLYGHWRAGLVVFLTTFWWAWYYVLPVPKSFVFIDPTDQARVVLNAACVLIVLVFAEAFRRAASSTMDEIRERADRRLTALTELEHRTKNNFALVASLLEIQKRRIGNVDLHGPLDDAATRVRTFAEAYSGLASDQADHTEVEMAPYLNVLLDRVERAALPPDVELLREIEPMMLPRETAVAIGLYVNEAIANALKYAFPGGRGGKIGVFFAPRGDGWRLTIDDDGVGLDAKSGTSQGLGTSLMTAFAEQAGARHSSGPLLHGFRTELNTLPATVA